MSLNKYMHPRNKYKNKKPSFLELALKYPDFRKQVTQDDSGKVFLDFKNADALRALTTCLMKEDFDLTVYLPSNRLVPTLPLRLNYLHWLEDIIGPEPGKWGIDVGTGSSCVYPLLGAKMQRWNFLATEADPENFFHAKKNVEANDLQELIHVKQVSVEDVLSDPMESFNVTDRFDFCMCNPPFFADHMEAQAVTSSRSLDRPDAHSMSTASPEECIAKGGEVGFVRQMIEESTVLQDKIRVYSSMVGKKTSLAQLKEELRHQKVPKFATTEFCQGKTMRWGIAWSFDESVTFPKSHFIDSKKEKKPIQFVIPKGSGGVQYNVHAIADFLKDVLTSLKIHCYQGKSAKSYTSITLTAAENTWCHQRRRRRQQKRQEQEEITNNSKNETPDNSLNGTDSDNLKSTEIDGDCMRESGDQSFTSKSAEESNNKKRPLKDDLNDDESTSSKVMRLGDVAGNFSSEGKRGLEKTDCSEKACSAQPNPQATCTPQTQAEMENSFESEQVVPSEEIDDECAMAEKESPKNYIVKCVMRLKRAGTNINMELKWLGGESFELLHQIKTFLINKLGEHDRLSKSKGGVDC